MLRPPTLDDAPAHHAIFSRPEVVRFRPDPTPFSAERSIGVLRGDIAHWDRWGFGRWAIRYEDQVIGFGGLSHRAGFEGLNLGYHLHPDYWGRGFASELASAAASYGFTVLGANRLIGLVRPQNLASIHVLEKLGMVPAGDVVSDGHPSRFFTLDRPG